MKYLHVAIAIALGVWAFVTLAHHGTEDVATEHSRVALKLASQLAAKDDTLKRTQAKLVAIAAAKRTEQRAEEARADSLRSQLDTAHSAAESLQVWPVVAAHLIMAGRACTVAFRADSLALNLCSMRVDSLRVANDSLAHSLLGQIKVTRCRVWIVPCPSRVQAFLYGGGLATAAFALIHR